MKKHVLLGALVAIIFSLPTQAQRTEQNHAERFEQLGTELRSPNVYRTASGDLATCTGSNKPTMRLK